MFLTRGQLSPVAESGWGNSIEPERWAAILRHTRAGMRVLDVGTGRGAYIAKLLSAGYAATGVDLRRYPEWDVIGADHFIVTSGATLPFADKAFDVTILFEVLEHCADPAAMLKEIVRCTAHTLVLSVPNCDLNNSLRRHDLVMAHWSDPTHVNFFTKDSLVELLSSMGLLQGLDVRDCYRINPADYFWDTLRMRPAWLKDLLRNVSTRLQLSEQYWSSILVTVQLAVRDDDPLSMGRSGL